MADIQATPNQVLNSIAARLLQRAEAITNVTCQDLADDLRLTSGIVEKLARCGQDERYGHSQRATRTAHRQ
jgi:hypothetical protein